KSIASTGNRPPLPSKDTVVVSASLSRSPTRLATLHADSRLRDSTIARDTDSDLATTPGGMSTVRLAHGTSMVTCSTKRRPVELQSTMRTAEVSLSDARPVSDRNRATSTSTDVEMDICDV